MMGREITRIADLGSRPAEAGRIRLGVKTKARSGKDKPTSIDVLRFTSPHEDCIRAIAAQFGGTAQPWDEPSARIRNQWEVITETADVPVLLPADALSSAYEEWSGGIRQRHCDGEVCQVPRKINDADYEFVDAPCLCLASGERACKPKTRLHVVLPDVPFRGVWRVETSSWTALEELPYQVEMLQQIQAARGRLVQARLSLMKESKNTPVGRRNYVVPRLSMDATPMELAAGGGGLAELAAGVPVSLSSAGRELTSGSARPDEAPAGAVDDDIVDAEIVDDGPLLAGLAADAEQFGLDAARFVTAARRGAGCPSGPLTDDARQKLIEARQRMASGELEPTGFKNDGSVAWNRNR